MKRGSSTVLAVLRHAIIAALVVLAATADAGQRITMSFQDMPFNEVMEMLSRQERVNILVSEGLDAKVSFNLYDVDLDEAIHSIAEAAGFAVEKRKGSYYIVDRDEAGKYAVGDLTRLKTFKVQYTDPVLVEKILKKHLSKYGKITTLPKRNIIAVEDTPEFLKRIGTLLNELDREPKQILIEAKILEITLNDAESFGIDWSKLFTSGRTSGSVGIQGLASPKSPGLFFKLMSPSVELALDALKTRGRLRTLSTPKLLAMENEEASTVVGDRIGFKVTTTINQVTTESIKFLESGVILRVTPSVDRQGRILLDVHPEVSTASVSDDGIPSKRTTQVSTMMLVPDGQTVFIGGLIKHIVNESREGVPVLGDLPGVGLLFRNNSKNVVNTETVVLITPKVIKHPEKAIALERRRKYTRVEQLMRGDAVRAGRKMDELMGEGGVPTDDRDGWLSLDGGNGGTPRPVPGHPKHDGPKQKDLSIQDLDL